MPGKCVFNKLWIDKEEYREWLLADNDRHKAKCTICTKQGVQLSGKSGKSGNVLEFFHVGKIGNYA